MQWSRIPAWGVGNLGSNPSDPTILSEIELKLGLLIPIDSQIIREIFAYCMYQVFPLIPTVSNVMFDSVAIASLFYESFNSTYRTFSFHL